MKVQLTGALIKATKQSCGYDLSAEDDFIIHPKQNALIGTGVRLVQQEGLGALVLPRSGLAKNKQVAMIGLIDTDYVNGHVIVNIINFSDEVMEIKKGDRIAQLAFVPFVNPEFIGGEVHYKNSERGDKGHGSTGVS